MGTSHDDFTKYPRTPHRFGSPARMTTSISAIGSLRTSSPIPRSSSRRSWTAPTSVSTLHPWAVWSFSAEGMRLPRACTPNTICSSSGRWAALSLEAMLEDRLILFGEWLYARHSVHYRRLPHYFFEFDIYDKQRQVFLDLASRLTKLEGTGILTVPILHRGPETPDGLRKLIAPSRYDSQFENPLTGRTDNLMEGLYLRTKAEGCVTGRAKYVRTEFVERVKQSEHWQHQAMVPNLLAPDAEIWS